jgi:hypothetical protein
LTQSQGISVTPSTRNGAPKFIPDCLSVILFSLAQSIGWPLTSLFDTRGDSSRVTPRFPHHLRERLDLTLIELAYRLSALGQKIIFPASRNQ